MAARWANVGQGLTAAGTGIISRLDIIGHGAGQAAGASEAESDQEIR